MKSSIKALTVLYGNDKVLRHLKSETKRRGMNRSNTTQALCNSPSSSSSSSAPQMDKQEKHRKALMIFESALKKKEARESKAAGRGQPSYTPVVPLSSKGFALRPRGQPLMLPSSKHLHNMTVFKTKFKFPTKHFFVFYQFSVGFVKSGKVQC